MSSVRHILFFFIPLIMLMGCGHRQKNKPLKEPYGARLASLPIKYAKGFTVEYYKGYKVIAVRDLTDSTKILAQYILRSKSQSAPHDLPNAVLITTPVTRVVCVATNQIAEMKRLSLIPFLVGITGPQLVYDSAVRAAVKTGSIADLGQQELSYEKLLAAHPEFVFTSGVYDDAAKLKAKLTDSHIALVLNLDFREQEPLARAEWLKFVAAFFDRESEADSIFDRIEKRYLALKAKAQSAENKPTVFCNLPFKEIWYMPSGDNYAARLIADAGGDFLWQNSKPTNGLSLSLDYEAVYAKAAHADFWLNTGIASSLADIRKIEGRSKLFAAYQKHQVYNNDLRKTDNGAFDFWESGVVNPDKVLGDLIYIFHPDLLPNHQLYYYRKLN